MKHNNKIYPFLLILMGIATHFNWFSPRSIITYADWTYWHDESVRQLWYSWGTWLGFWNTGSQNIQIYFNLFTVIWSALAALGLSFDSAVKLTFLIPIAIIGFLAPYYLFRRLIDDNFIAFLVALYYGTTTYFIIRQTAHLHLAFVYAVFPLLLLCFQVALERKNTKYWLIFTLFYSIGIGYEIRMMYIFTLVAIIFIALGSRQDRRALLASAMIILPLVILLNSYWLLPTLFGGLGEAISSTANRGLFGNIYFDIVHAIALHESTWTGSLPNQEFVKQSVQWYFLAFPIIAMISFFRPYKIMEQRCFIFYAFLTIAGIFLTKQAGSPFSGAYLWLYENFPGFNLFREASKFYIITALGYSGMLTYALSQIKHLSSKLRKPQLFNGVVIIFLILIGWQIRPLVNGEMRTLFVSRAIPADYSLMKTWINKKEPHFYRTLWVPDYSRWSFFTNENPIVSAVQKVPSWMNIIHVADKQIDAVPLQISEVLNQSSSSHFLKLSGVRYLAIPVRDVANDDDFFRFYGYSRDYYVNLLDRLSYLKQVNIGTQELRIYENEGARPRIYTTDVTERLGKPVSFKSLEYQMLSPTEYHVTIHNMSAPILLHFVENYNQNWVLRLGTFSWTKLFFNKSYFMDDQFHQKTDIGLNVFYMTPEYIKEALPSNAYDLNQDGSLTFKLTIFFKPQSYFYLGVIISITFLLLSVTFLFV